jgi:hypothetical protein
MFNTKILEINQKKDLKNFQGKIDKDLEFFRR